MNSKVGWLCVMNVLIVIDPDNLFHDELVSMKGNQLFKYFYMTLNVTREYHQRYPNIQVESSIPLPFDASNDSANDIPSSFSIEKNCHIDI